MSAGLATLYLEYTPDCQNPWHPVDEDSLSLYVVDLRITNIVGVTVAAFSENRFCFNDARPGVCSLSAQGTTGLSQWDDGLVWTLTAINGSTLTTDPAPPTGGNVTFTYTGLPSLNSEFGTKLLTLSHPNIPWTVTQEIEIYYMFCQPGQANWPGAAPVIPLGGSQPSWYYCPTNWYYYYSQTTASMGCEYKMAGSECWPTDFPEYTPYVGALQNPRPALSYTDPRSGESIANNGDTLYGIDCFAWASRHEFKHHVDYSAWWGTTGGWNPNLDCDPRPPGFGGQGDYLIDADEEAGFAPSAGGPFYWWTAVTHTSAPSWGYDDQSECLFSQDPWSVGSLAGQDWAYPGSQWH